MCVFSIFLEENSLYKQNSSLELRMKIGILTLPLHTNYGGILQAYALQTFLTKMGHDVVVFNKKYYHPETTITDKTTFKKIARKNISNTYHQLLSLLRIKQKNDPYYKINSFISENIHLYKVNDWYKINSHDFQAIVVGSDQIFRSREIHKQICWEDITIPYLSFTSKWNIIRLSYAASFGIDYWDYTNEETRKCQQLINHFDGVSVREKSGVELCNKYLKCKAQHVIDPTMLLSKKDYIDIFLKNKTPQHKGTLLKYILDKNADKNLVVNTICNKYGLIPFSINTLSNGYYTSIEEWLRGFYDAEFVVTDSFHACVFSIIFGKPFVVYGNKTRGMARFESLLNMFGLSKNLIYSSKDLHLDDIFKNVGDVSSILKKHQEESAAFLYNHLNK